jgi:5-methyltetrahydropteroyltriglutamate--homocysteine methyltransferase
MTNRIAPAIHAAAAPPRVRQKADRSHRQHEGIAMALLPTHLIPTTVVGSYPQPDWLVDRAMLSKVVPRVRMTELWRVPGPYLEQAQDDATLIAIRDMERAGIDVITDGEMRRESYSNRFATALEGIDFATPGTVTPLGGRPTPVPRIVGKVRRPGPVEVRDMQFLRANTDRPAKITLPGPFTMGQQAKDEYYQDDEALAMDLAAAVNAEAHDLVRAGADMIQLDEPWVRHNPELARRYAVKAINRALAGISVPTVIHLCFGYGAVVAGNKPQKYAFLAELAGTTADQISFEAAQPNIDLGVIKDLAPKQVLLGVLNLASSEIETPELVAQRLRKGLAVCPPERLIAAPDCGMKYLSREVAFGKLKVMVEGAAIVRREVS